MSTAFLEANNIKIYAFLWDFTKCRNLRIKKGSWIPGSRLIPPVVRHSAENVRHYDKNVRQGAKNVRHAAENV